MLRLLMLFSVLIQYTDIHLCYDSIVLQLGC